MQYGLETLQNSSRLQASQVLKCHILCKSLSKETLQSPHHINKNVGGCERGLCLSGFGK